ncbi:MULTISPECIES: DJ-1/PfpI family protein [Nostocales]|uniref:DJ-1/PfpI family protein n=3 Tax=Nostocales TaxID=1161 RepID=A0A0C1N482_9CYAN|nr:DJ-1/PfpI family protein [Tolypothrix bouteillei]KAF3889296.1 DJ-1/PfpI family protein [Tolypothrix bouteillei VB521301]
MNTQNSNKLQIGIFISPNCYIPDIIGVYTVFSVVPDCDIHFIWENTDLIVGYPNFPMHATTTFAECPSDLDVLCIGASTGILSDEALEFLVDRGNKAKYLIGICGGSLMLAAVGLLKGYRATATFSLVEELRHFGAIPVTGGEVVADRNRITASPVSGSFDAALIVLGKLRGEDAGKEVELTIEYAPHPPYGTGSPELAGHELTQKVLQKYAVAFDEFRKVARQVSERLAGVEV